MKYFVVRVKFLKDGTIKKNEVMDFDTEIQAIAKLHSNLATDMADGTLKGSACMVLNENFYVIKSESWRLPEEEV